MEVIIDKKTIKLSSNFKMFNFLNGSVWAQISEIIILTTFLCNTDILSLTVYRNWPQTCDPYSKWEEKVTWYIFFKWLRGT